MDGMDARQWLEHAMEVYEQPLLRMCFAYLGDAALAEDAVQETFVKAFRGLSRYRGGASEKTWLMRIAINTCKDMRRAAWFRHIDRGISLDELPETAAPYTAWDDTLTRAIMRLERKYREVVLLHFYQGMSMRETATALGVTKSTVYNRMKRAQALLRDELKGWYDDDQ